MTVIKRHFLQYLLKQFSFNCIENYFVSGFLLFQSSFVTKNQVWVTELNTERKKKPIILLDLTKNRTKIELLLLTRDV